MSFASEKGLAYLSGGGGVREWTTAPTTATGTYRAIYFLRNSNLTSVISADIVGATRISSKTTFAAGSVLQGVITKVKTKAGAMFLIS